MAGRQEAERLHLCPARSSSASGVDDDFCYGPLTLRFARHSRVGSSSGSGVSCGGRSASGTWRRFTRMRVQVDDLPRMESTSTSSTARRLATSACLLFHLSSPASAASLFGEFATTTSGIFVRGVFEVDLAVDVALALAREGATRCGSPSILRK